MIRYVQHFAGEMIERFIYRPIKIEFAMRISILNKL